MALFSWSRTGFGRTWSIEIGTGTSADLLVKKWPVLDFVKRPTKKDAGVYPRKLTIPIVDYDSSNGYLREAVFDSELECTLELDSSVVFKGIIYQSDIIKSRGEDQYDTEITVSDGLERLGRSDAISGTYTYEELLKELLWESGFELDIHFYTDWEEDNAQAGLTDTHRFTIEADTYMQALQDFCNNFGYQVYQEDGAWVVRSLAYFAGASVTRYVITSGGVTSSSVTLTETITGLYKSTDEDLMRGLGKVNVSFEWSTEEGDSELKNSDFEAFTNSEFESWITTGSPTQFQSGSEYYARVEGGDELRQFIEPLVLFGDRITIDARAVVQFTGSPSGIEDAEWLEIIFKDYRGQRYWLQNDGTVTTTQTFISENNISNPTVLYDADFLCIGATGFPVGFAGTMEVRCRIDVKFDGSTTEFDSFDFDYVRVDYSQNAQKYSGLVSTAENGTLSIRDLSLTYSQNNRQTVGGSIEYLDTGVWYPALAWDGITHGEKRARDELIVRNQNMEMIRAKMDYSDYKGLSKIYADGAKEFIPLVSTINIGLDDVEVVFVRHERTVETINVNDEFTS